ncbi:hypothetical protein Taro_007848 [Colocasia esculenta]|uniref:Uncharacterized protein n=1 Tax=Colocasia esculenta TaxID=4460 RepID=A0A843U567_COLES|nr:hypothetical protein [Colocasia esculenta]
MEWSLLTSRAGEALLDPGEELLWLFEVIWRFIGVLIALSTRGRCIEQRKRRVVASLCILREVGPFVRDCETERLFLCCVVRVCHDVGTIVVVVGERLSGVEVELCSVEVMCLDDQLLRWCALRPVEVEVLLVYRWCGLRRCRVRLVPPAVVLVELSELVLPRGMPQVRSTLPPSSVDTLQPRSTLTSSSVDTYPCQGDSSLGCRLSHSTFFPPPIHPCPSSSHSFVSILCSSTPSCFHGPQASPSLWSKVQGNRKAHSGG